MPKQLQTTLGERDIQNLIADLEDQKVVLPDFQRDFVWPTYQVAKLLESLLNGYYINTLLIVPTVQENSDGNTLFPYRPIKGTNKVTKDPLQMDLVLDGQQRITSIYYALTFPGYPLQNTVHPQLFYLKFNKVIRGELDEEVVDWRRGDWKSSQKLVDNDLSLQVEEGMVPFTIFRSKKTFKQWRRGMESFVEENSQYSREDIDAFDDNTEVFRNYKIPMIKMGTDTEYSKIVKTFERINTQGLELGVFDILTARLYPHKINLRELWEETAENNPRIKNFADSEGRRTARESLLKSLALYRGKECKDKSLRKLSPNNFKSDWRNVSCIMERAIEKAKSPNVGGFGVTDKFGFPYGALLPTLAILTYLAEEEGKTPNRKSLEKIQKWYWTSVFSRRYSGSSDTYAYRDFQEVKQWMNNDEKVPSSVIEGIDLIPTKSNLKNVISGGVYKGVMSLLVLNGAKDFGTLDSVSVHKVDDHHIFPRSKLRSGIDGKTYGKTERNRILNRTIIEYRSNRFKYHDELPSEYVSKMIDEHDRGEKGVKEVLKGHFIGEVGFEALLSDDYELFCEARKEKIWEAIEGKVGEQIEWSKRGT